MAIARDGCVVDTEPLSHLLNRFVTDWNRDRPSDGGRFTVGSRRREASDFVGAVAWLAAESRVPEPSIENVLQGRTATTELRIADPLVQALGRPEALHDGTLAVRPNRLATAAAQAACCGGSESTPARV